MAIQCQQSSLCSSDVKADVIPLLSNSCWTASLWKFLEIALTVSKGGTLYCQHLPQTVQAKGIFWEIQWRRKPLVQSMMHSKGGLHQNTFSSFRKGSSHKFMAMFCYYIKAQFHSKNWSVLFFSFVCLFLFFFSLIYFHFTVTRWSCRMFWTEESEGRLGNPRLKQLSRVEFIYLFWKEVGETPTNPSAIHLWKTDALIRNDSFATGSKPTCTTTLWFLYAVAKAAWERQLAWLFPVFLPYQPKGSIQQYVVWWEHRGLCWYSEEDTEDPGYAYNWICRRRTQLLWMLLWYLGCRAELNGRVCYCWVPRQTRQEWWLRSSPPNK